MEKYRAIESNDAFDAILMQAIKQTSLSSLGRNQARKIFLYLEKEWGIKKRDVPFRISEFSLAIEKALGTEAFNFKTKLLIEIQKKLDEKAKPKAFDCLVPNLTFEDYIQIKQLLYLLTEIKNSEVLRSVRPTLLKVTQTQ